MQASFINFKDIFYDFRLLSSEKQEFRNVLILNDMYCGSMNNNNIMKRGKVEEFHSFKGRNSFN